MALTIDMEKVYDRVHCPFLFKVLQLYGFHSKFIQGIKLCATQFQYALLMQIDWLGPSRGSRQGCPFFPYLFILCSKILSNFLKVAMQSHLLRGLIDQVEGAHRFFIFCLQMMFSWLQGLP